ncbi:MAG: prohibitin family protein [Bacteroidota bacterium]|nr:prohibitin family protein [Bacteroidota bacterium]MDP4232139.1 prohibitin family protein [Bacteroidota bacterium]MDP4241153.1 prohibitin family protein [Bacteroidota bacterium]MDP4286545.1 prohibitin family protein [Bacteroidota bacterium]
MASLFFALILIGIGILLLYLRKSRVGSVSAGGQLNQANVGRIAGMAAPIFFVIALLVIAIGSFVTIDPGEVGVQVFFGDVQQDVLESGFHVINPLINVVQMDQRTQAYTMSAKTNEGQIKGDDAIQVLSQDGLTLTLEVTVQYHLSPESAPKVYNSIGLDYVEKVVRPEIRSALRDAAVNYLATDLYASRRDEYTGLVKSKLLAAFKNRGIVLEGVLLRDILLPEKVRTAIDEKIAAEQESQKMQYVLQRERQEADRKRVEAGGISDAQKIIAGSLTNQYLQYNYISTLKELVNSKNSTFVITPFDSKLTPMLNVNPNK